MPNFHISLYDLFTDIASAIRAKTDYEESICADDFPAMIHSIPTGGGNPLIPDDTGSGPIYTVPAGTVAEHLHIPDLFGVEFTYIDLEFHINMQDPDGNQIGVIGFSIDTENMCVIDNNFTNVAVYHISDESWDDSLAGFSWGEQSIYGNNGSLWVWFMNMLAGN